MAESDLSEDDGRILPAGPRAVPYIPRSISPPSTPTSSDEDIDVYTRDFSKLAQRNGHPLNEILKTGQQLSTINYMQSVPRTPKYSPDDDVSSQFHAMGPSPIKNPSPIKKLSNTLYSCSSRNETDHTNKEALRALQSLTAAAIFWRTSCHWSLRSLSQKTRMMVLAFSVFQHGSRPIH